MPKELKKGDQVVVTGLPLDLAIIYNGDDYGNPVGFNYGGCCEPSTYFLSSIFLASWFKLSISISIFFFFFLKESIHLFHFACLLCS